MSDTKVLGTRLPGQSASGPMWLAGPRANRVVRATPSDLERSKRGIESPGTQWSGFREGACKCFLG